MEIIKNALDKILATICTILFGGMVILVTWQVITRFIFNNPSAVSEELAKYGFVWLVLFGAAFVFGENGHMAIDFIKDKFPRKLQMITEVFIEVVVFSFSALVLVKGGFAATSLAWNQMNASLNLPMGYLYLAIPLSGIFTMYYCIYNIYIISKKKKPLEEINLPEGG
jgi:TRAP-type C4-dicarboxylate transport system permease small subunit